MKILHMPILYIYIYIYIYIEEEEEEEERDPLKGIHNNILRTLLWRILLTKENIFYQADPSFKYRDSIFFSSTQR